MTDERKPDHAINPIFTTRWSARSFTGDTMPAEDILSMFEAARWAHSSANRQPHSPRTVAAFGLVGSAYWRQAGRAPRARGDGG